METVNICGHKVPYIEYDALIVGSGAAGYNAADTLYSLGKRNIAMITEGKNMGISRNTGSDKQTYYKLSTSGRAPDSVYDMAKTYFDGGSMHGDIALIEAAYSLGCFFKLTGLNVPFPTNDFGEYVGYRTDHDERVRATSCGPLTSKFMTEALEKAVEAKGIQIFDGYRVFKIITKDKRAIGLIAINRDGICEENPLGLTIFAADNIVYAVGGPSAIYLDSVYPESQTCALGAAFEAGAEGESLTESQYGIASLKFRWNLSGTYQQVLPRYVSIDKDGNEREFLNDTFGSPEAVASAVFLKGYQWPFDPSRADGGSSMVDIAVYNERALGRRVYLDFTRNITGLDIEKISDEAKDYLINSGALNGTPIERLKIMNKPAIDLYASHGIDIENELLEIAVCAQHANGGLAITTDYESTTLSHLFPVGECAGMFGVRRPGGSALNSTQVSSTRAAQKIAYDKETIEKKSAATECASEIYPKLTAICNGTMTVFDIIEKRREYGEKMSRCGAFLRDVDMVNSEIKFFENEYKEFSSIYSLNGGEFLAEATINRDIIITAISYLSAIRDYIADNGGSRGSYMIMRDGEKAPLDKDHTELVEYTAFKNGSADSYFIPRRPIPDSEQWFEKVYNAYLKKRA